MLVIKLFKCTHATILFKQCWCNYFYIYFFYFRKLTGYEESKSKKQTFIKNDETVTAIEQTNAEDNENTNEQDQEEHIEGKLLIKEKIPVLLTRIVKKLIFINKPSV